MDANYIKSIIRDEQERNDFVNINLLVNNVWLSGKLIDTELHTYHLVLNKENGRFYVRYEVIEAMEFEGGK